MRKCELQVIQEEYTRKIFNETYLVKSKKLLSYMESADVGKLKSEFYGRRMLVAIEIMDRFKSSMKEFFLRDDITPIDFIKDEQLSSFFDSENFLKSHHCLPSPEGIGKGYENISKFYFWAMTNIKSKEFIEMLKLEMASYVLSQSLGAVDNFFNKFSNGIFIESIAGGYLVTKEGDVFEMNNQEHIRNIKDLGVFNLKDLLMSGNENERKGSICEKDKKFR